MSNLALLYLGDNPRLYTRVGSKRGNSILLNKCLAGCGLYGPYVNLPRGRYYASVRFAGGDRLKIRRRRHRERIGHRLRAGPAPYRPAPAPASCSRLAAIATPIGVLQRAAYGSRTNSIRRTSISAPPPAA
jgi:hypothetical protein